MNRRAIYLLCAVGAMVLLLGITHMHGPSRSDSFAVTGTKDVQAAHPAIATTRPAALPPEFAILETVNPFGPGGPAGGRESTLVFKGVAHTGDLFLAFIEDTTAKNVSRVKAGDPVAAGRVASIDINGLVYEAAGSSRRIEVGQNFNGETPPPPPPPPPPKPADAAAEGPPDGAPPQPGQDGPPPEAAHKIKHLKSQPQS